MRHRVSKGTVTEPGVRRRDGPAAATILGLDVDTDEHYFSDEDQRLYIDLCRELDDAGYIEKADPEGLPDRLEEYVAVRLTRSGIDAARE